MAIGIGMMRRVDIIEKGPRVRCGGMPLADG